MSEKSFKKSEFKRTIDLGKTDRGQDTDLIRVWRESSGEEKAISLGDINGGLIGDYVPYTGAVDNVNLGEKGLSAGYVKYDTTPTSTPTDQGTSYWDVDDNTLAIIMNGTTLKVGEDQYYPVKNQTGVLIPKGTAVRFAGTLGASGRLLIAPFLADGSIPSSRFMGVTSEDIDNGADGKVMWFGRIRGLNTNAFNEGDILYASTTVAGGFQTTVPEAPNNIVQVCAVISKSVSNGIIFVRPTFASNINKDEGVKLTTPTTGDLLQLQVSGLWENVPVSSIYTPVTIGSPANGLDINPSTQVLTIGLASTSATGALSSTDWNTFNGKIGGSIGLNQIAFGTSLGTIAGDSGFVWDNVNKTLGIGRTPTGIVIDILRDTSSALIRIRGGSANGQGASLYFTQGASNTTLLAIGDGANMVGGSVNNAMIFCNVATLNYSFSGTTRFQMTSTGSFGVNTISPTNTLDVNGTTRIRTISNLGVAATSVLVPDATGVVSLRTVSELASDLGAVTLIGTQTITGRKTFTSVLEAHNSIQGEILTDLNTPADSSRSVKILTSGFQPLNRPASNYFSGVQFTPLDTNNGYKGQFGVQSSGNENAFVLRVTDAVGTWFPWRTLYHTGNLINPITGTIASDQVAFGTGTNTLGGDSGFTYTSASKFLLLTGTDARFQIRAITPTIAGGQGQLTIRSTDAVAVDKGGIISFNADTTSLAGYPVAHIAGKLEAVGTGVYSGYLQFLTTASNGAVTERWRITSTGVFQSNGAQTIQTSTGNLTLATNGGNGNVNIIPNGTGRVGINTSSPSAKFEVALGAIGEYMRVGGDDASNARALRFSSSNDGAVGNLHNINAASAVGILTFSTASTERIRITSTGLVGIGGITPTNTLDVNGTARIRTISNLGVSATNVLVPDATGVVSLRTLTELISDAGLVTIADTQTITGTKTFTPAQIFVGEIQQKSATGTLSFGMFEGNTATRTWGIYNVNTDHDFGIIRYGGLGNKLMFSIDRSTDSGYFNGKFLIGSSGAPTTATLQLAGNLDGGVTAWGTLNNQIIQSTVTTSARVFQSSPATQATAFTLPDLYHFLVSPSTFGLGSTVTNQYGFSVTSGLTGATNNFAFQSSLASGTGRWNLYMSGTANNYLAGSLWIGTTSGTNPLDVNGSVRVRTISNLGVAATNVLVPDATGVLSLRTVAELRTDIGAIGGTGTLNYLPKFTASNTIGISQIFDNGTNIGIGTTTVTNSKVTLGGAFAIGINSPVLSFNTSRWFNVWHDSGFARMGVFVEGDTATGTEKWTHPTLRGQYFSFGNNVLDFNYTDVSTGTGNTITGLATLVRFSSTNQRVGILTTSPTNTLDVNGTARVRSLTAGRVTFAGTDGVLSDDSALTWDSANKILNGRFRVNSPTNLIGSGIWGVDTALAFNVNSVERMRIDSSGRLLINTTSGTNTLDVNGTARIRTISNLGVSATNVLVPDATGVVSLRTASEFLADAGGISGSGTVNYLPKYTASNTLAISQLFDNGTNIGIGTTVPTRKLDIVGDALNVRGGTSIVGSGTSMGWISGSYGFIQTFGSVPLVINGLGNSVWIGTTSGTNTLDVNGTARIRTISNLGVSATNVLVPDATGVLSLRTVSELASDLGAVTLTGTQTITGAKTFNNSLLVQSASNPVFRIATTDNTAIVNFRNVFGEDAAGVEMSTPATELAVVTRVSNYNIRIEPHGTGKIKLPNVPSGTGDVLGRDASNNLVIVSGTITQTTGTFTPTLTDNGGGYTYTLSSANGFYIKTGRLVFIIIKIAVTSTSGSPLGGLSVGNLPFTSLNDSNSISSLSIGKMSGTNWSTALLDQLTCVVNTNSTNIGFGTLTSVGGNSAPSITSGDIWISGTYYSNS